MPLIVESPQDEGSSYIVLKFYLTAALSSVELSVINVPASVGISLKLDNGDSLDKQNSILRYISSPTLLGVDSLSQSQVDRWLEFSWTELEVPVQSFLSLSSPTFKSLSDEEKTAVREKSRKDIHDNLIVLDDHLSSRTFLVGERVTVADLSIFAVYHYLHEFYLQDYSTPYSSLIRWYNTIKNISLVAASIKSFTFFHGSKVSMEGIEGKWDRHRIRVKELLKQGESSIGKEVVVKGWVRTCRSAEKGSVLFVELTDGSTIKGMQLVLNSASSIG